MSKCICALLILCGVAAAEPWDSYQLVRLAPEVYAFVAPEPVAPIVDCNSLVVIGDDGVLVFDTGQFPPLVRKKIAEIRKLTAKPVRYVVNSHWHFDHTNGNAEYRDAFPGVVIVSHDFTRERGIAKFDHEVKQFEKTYEEVAAQVRTILDKNVRADGKPLSAEQRSYFERLIVDGKRVIPFAQEARHVPPQLTFDDELTLHLGKREVRLVHLGRGNTAGDVMAWLPDEKILASGDAVVAPVPYSYGSYPAEWIGVLKKLQKLQPATLLPGHGPVMHDLSYVKTVEELLQATVMQSVAPTLEEARKKVDLTRFRDKLAGENVARRQSFADYVYNSVERAWQEAHGKLTVE